MNSLTNSLHFGVPYSHTFNFALFLSHACRQIRDRIYLTTPTVISRCQLFYSYRNLRSSMLPMDIQFAVGIFSDATNPRVPRV